NWIAVIMPVASQRDDASELSFDLQAQKPHLAPLVERAQRRQQVPAFEEGIRLGSPLRQVIPASDFLPLVELPPVASCQPHCRKAGYVRAVDFGGGMPAGHPGVNLRKSGNTCLSRRLRRHSQEN